MKTVRNTINILKYVSGKGRSKNEISENLKLTEKTISNYLKTLVDCGFLEKIDTKYKSGHELALLLLKSRFNWNINDS
jgi:DNA-binding IclR family transcriptional regulator